MSKTVGSQPIDPVRPTDVSTVPVEAVRTTTDFSRCLDQVRIIAGPLSHREIETRSGGRLRRTKVGQVLTGELPRRDFLDTFLVVCGVPDHATELWHRTWTRLVTSPPTPKKPDPAQTQVHRPVPMPSQANEIRALRSALEAAAQRANLATELHETTARRLRSTEQARDQALDRVRRLSHDLHAARNDLELARQEIAALHEQPDPRATPDGPKRLTKYTQEEAETLFGTAAQTAPPTIGT